MRKETGQKLYDWVGEGVVHISHDKTNFTIAYNSSRY
jgi:hypothetical protein